MTEALANWFSISAIRTAGHESMARNRWLWNSSISWRSFSQIMLQFELKERPNVSTDRNVESVETYQTTISGRLTDSVCFIRIWFEICQRRWKFARRFQEEILFVIIVESTVNIQYIALQKDDIISLVCIERLNPLPIRTTDAIKVLCLEKLN